MPEPDGEDDYVRVRFSYLNEIDLQLLDVWEMYCEDAELPGDPSVPAETKRTGNKQQRDPRCHCQRCLGKWDFLRMVKKKENKAAQESREMEPHEVCLHPNCYIRAKVRGLCRSHYTSARVLLKNGLADEYDLITRGLILPKKKKQRKSIFLKGDKTLGKAAKQHEMKTEDKSDGR